MKGSEAFFNKTQKRYFYNIMPVANINSVVARGILCHDLADKFSHDSVALSDVQVRRSEVRVPNGMRLHSYANLYFTFNNPMMYLRKDMADELCILVVSIRVLDIEGCIVSDRNAAASLVKFYSPIEGIERIDFGKVYERYWTNHEDPYERSNHKQIKCAEILVPRRITDEYILGAYVVDDKVRDQMLREGFEKPIAINPKAFYR